MARAATSTQGSCPCSLGHGVSSLTDDFILVIESSAGHGLNPWAAGGGWVVVFFKYPECQCCFPKYLGACSCFGDGSHYVAS